MKIGFRAHRRAHGEAPSGTFTKAVARLSAASIVQNLFSAVGALLVARALGPEGRGIYSLSVTVAGTCALFLGLGAPTAVAWHTGQGRDPAWARRMGLAVGTVTFIGTVTAVTLLSRYGSLTYRELSALPVALLAGGFGFAYILIDALNALRRYRQSALLTAVASALVAVAATLSAYVTSDPQVAVWSIALVTVALYGVTSRTMGRSSTGASSRSQHSSLLGFAFLSWLGHLVKQMNFRLDMLLLAIWRGPEQVGIYAAAVTVAQSLWIVSNAAGQVAFVESTREHGGATDAEPFRKLVLTRTRNVLALTTLLGALLWSVGPWAIHFLLGSEFAPAAAPFRWLLPGVIGYGLVQIAGNALVGAGRPGVVTAASAVAAGVTVLGGIMFIPLHGAVAAAITSTIAYLLAGALTWLIALNHLKKQPDPAAAIASIDTGYPPA